MGRNQGTEPQAPSRDGLYTCTRPSLLETEVEVEMEMRVEKVDREGVGGRGVGGSERGYDSARIHDRQQTNCDGGERQDDDMINFNGRARGMHD